MSETRPLPRIPLLLAAVAAFGLLGVAALRMGPERPPGFHGTTYEGDAAAPAFSLVDHDGRRVTLDSYRGSPVLLFFGYTRCPDVCPLTLQKLVRATRQAGRRARGVRILLVTIDPARDTPPVLKQYAARFSPAVTGLTGDSASLAAALRGYGVYVARTAPAPAASHGPHTGHASQDTSSPARPPMVVHTAAVYGIDRSGNLQVVISDQATPSETADDIRTLARL
ncbi:MAG TPA: SCO family protein [Longimicrobium sp.]|nr:SCO family protein [Longimicrobium sp.]